MIEENHIEEMEVPKKRGRPKKNKADTILEKKLDALDASNKEREALKMQLIEEAAERAEQVGLTSIRRSYLERAGHMSPQLSYDYDEHTGCLTLKGGQLVHQGINLDCNESTFNAFVDNYCGKSFGRRQRANV